MSSSFQNHRWRNPRSLSERVEEFADSFFDWLDRPLKIIALVAIAALAINVIAHALRGP